MSGWFTGVGLLRLGLEVPEYLVADILGWRHVVEKEILITDVGNTDLPLCW